MRNLNWMMLAISILGLFGCNDSDTNADADVAQVKLNMTDTPNGVRCLVVTVDSAARKVSRSIDLTSGSAITASLVGLPTGNVSIGASAYPEPCSELTSSSVPTWVSDPAMQPMILFPGLTTSWNAALRPNGLLDATVDWLGDGANQGQSFAATAITAGEYHSCARVTSGSLQCWGGNMLGQLGDGTTTDNAVPVAVSGVSNATAVAAGEMHNCALLNDGSARCWGLNYYGQLGNGTFTESVVLPGQVKGVSNAIALASSYGHNCVLLRDSSLQCWGYNFYGQLGDGTTANRAEASAVTGISNVIAVSEGRFHSCALVTDGTVRCWGFKGVGQLGDGSTTDRALPVAAVGVANVVAVSGGGEHTCAVLSDGTVYCWGLNETGELGNGTTVNSPVPVKVSNISNATAVAAGGNHTCALLSDGSVQCWGYNSEGELGNGTITGSSVPVPVSGLTNAVSVVAGLAHTCALLNSGSVRCWGYNYYGALGNGTTKNSSVPVTVAGY